MDAELTHPCGHTASLDSSFCSKDRYRCPQCGLAWRIETVGKARVFKGFVFPPDRQIRIETQQELHLQIKQARPR